MRIDGARLVRIFRCVAALLLAAGLAAPAFAQAPAPAVVATRGYINGTPLAGHTTDAFDSRNATTLVVFVSSHPVWNGSPVSISGVSDNMGNAWSVLTGPTTWTGDSFTLMSAIYYIQAPVTSAAHTVTVTLTNGAPLVMHVVAAAGTDPLALPIYSPVVGPAAGPTTDVLTPSITVPQSTLLFAWAKNENSANAAALDSFTLDGQSTSFLWAEYATAGAPGAYSGHFDYSNPIGWQTAIVGLKPWSTPAASSASVTTFQNTPVDVTLLATSPNNFPLSYMIVTPPDHGSLTGVAPSDTYTPTTGYVGPDSFTFKANDGTADSNVATISITVRLPNRPPVASDSTVTVTTGVPSAVGLNASDPDGDPLTFVVVTPPAHGTLTGTGSSGIYTSNGGYIGGDSFTFKVNDGLADSNLAQVTLDVAAQPPASAIVSTRGYINGTPVSAHTTTAFDSRNASTLVAYVSSHPAWNGAQVSISGVTDNMGNTWQLLTGPTTWVGNSFTLMSAIYYVQLPATSQTHTVTANLTNVAPLVLNVVAVSGTDFTGPPTYSPIVNPSAGSATDVLTPSITATPGTLLYAWAKNENSANATALDGYTLDGQSTSFLWAEYATAGSFGQYAGHFRYDQQIGWQSAIVGVRPATGPMALNGFATTFQDTPVNVTLSGVSPSNHPLSFVVVAGPSHGGLTGTPPNLTYMPAPGYIGSDSFTFKAIDGSAESNVATVSITVRPPDQPPVANNASATVEAGASVPVTLTATDADHDPLTYQIATPPTHGTLSGVAPNLTYTPAAGYAGADSFAFVANDGVANSNVATVSISVIAVPPAILGFTPTSGGVGTSVTISGTGLLATTQVRFNGTVQSVFTTGAASPLKSNFTTNAGPIAAVVGDLDGDGKPEIAVANHGFSGNIGNTISVFRNLGTPGTVALAPKVDFVTTNGPHDIAMADIDGDGKPDLVMPNYGANASGNTISVMRNTSTVGNLTFSPSVNFTTAFGPPDLAIGDLDGDGKPDVVATSFNDGSGTVMSLLRNTSTPGAISFDPKLDYGTAKGPYGVALGDLDGDGKLDIVVSIFGSFAGDGMWVGVYRNLSTPGSLLFAAPMFVQVGGGPREVAIGDLDGDGRPEIVVSNYGGNGTNNTISVLRNQSVSGTLDFAPKADYTVGPGPIRVRLQDLTGDGRLDVLVALYANGVGQTVSLLRNASTPGNVFLAPKVDFPTGVGPHGLAVGDIDGDGVSDIIPANYGNLQGNGSTISVLRFTGDSQVTTTVPAGATSGPLQVVTPGGTATSGQVFTLPTLSINSVSVAEGNTGSVNATFTVTLSPAASQPVIVNYATANGTAAAGADYTTTTGTLTFAPGTTTQTITVPVLGDTLDEPDETFTVNLSGAVNASIATATGTGTIVDDDPPPSLSINSVSVTEGNSGSVNATFTVTLSAASGKTITVNYSTANGTAIAGSDYTATSGSLTFTPGVTSRTITVAVLGDTLDEANETFTVNLNSPVNATVATGTGTGTIVDNDPTPSLSINNVSVTEGNTGSVNAAFTVTLSAASGQTVSVNYATANGTATAGGDYTATSGTLTFAPGTTTQTINVAVLGDTLDEPNETFTVNLSGAVNATIADSSGTGTIVDNDPTPSVSINNVSVTEGNTGSVNATFTVTLSAASGQTVTVIYSTANGTATAGSDYTTTAGALTFAPGVTTQTITVAVLGDLLNEANETFAVNLLVAINATIATATGTGTIIDNEPVPSLTINNVSVTEGNTGSVNATFTVTLSAASGRTVTVNYATANGTATAGSDYTATSGTLTFTPGATTRTITVPVLGDTLDEPNQTFTVNLSGAVNASITTATGTGTIVDNDPTPSLTINNVSVTEGNTGSVNATFTVTLSAASGQTVTVNYATANGTATAGSDYTATSGTLTFTPGATTRTITVAVLGDTLVEPNQTFTVNLSGAVNASISDGTGIGTIVNND